MTHRGSALACGVTLGLCLAAVPANAGIPPTLGWYDIPNTAFKSVEAPDNWNQYGIVGPAAVVGAWSSAAGDPNHNRMLLFGGGHADYYGNEVYELDLNALSVSRLTAPSQIPNPYTMCVSTTPDGNPTSRHTYGGLTYIANIDKMFACAGAFAPCGGPNVDTWVWTFDPSMADPTTTSTASWTHEPVTGTPPPSGWTPNGIFDVAAYDPNTELVFFGAGSGGATYTLMSYSHAQQSWTTYSSGSQPSGNMTAAIDPGRKLFFIAGGGHFYAADISGTDPNYTLQDWSKTVSGCSALLGVSGPGIAYDAVQKVLVGWSGGDTAYLLNPDSKTPVSTIYGSVAPQTCLAITTYSGGPPSPNTSCGGPPNCTCTPGPSYPPGFAQCNGTYGRFQYFPLLNLFAVVNDWGGDAFTLRLTTGGTGPGDASLPLGDGSTAEPSGDAGTSPSGSGGSDGCSCLTAGAGAGGVPFTAAAVAVVLMWRRRRRR